MVLGGDERVGTAASFGLEIKVARLASDGLLDVCPPILDRLQAPLLLIRRKEEYAQSTAVATCAFERVGPGPVPWCLQRQGDAPAQVVERRLSQPSHPPPCRALHPLRHHTPGGSH